MIRYDDLAIRIGLKISGDDWDSGCSILVDLRTNVHVVHFYPRCFERVDTPLGPETPSGLRQQSPDQTLVPGAKAGHSRRRFSEHVAGRVKLLSNVSESHALVLILQFRQSGVLARNDYPLSDCLIHKGLVRSDPRVTHDGYSVRVGCHRFLELGDHLFWVPI